YELEVLHPDCTIIMRGKERYRFQPWGLDGGQAGSLGSTALRSADGTLLNIGKRSRHRASAGDVFIVKGAGGGGFRSPLDRDPERVLADVQDGIISPERAREVYGVEIRDGAVDDEGTSRLRDTLQSEQSQAPLFDRGDGFRAWEATYGEASAIITEWLKQFRPRLRPLAKEQAYLQLAATGSAPWQPELIHAKLREIESKLGTGQHA